MTCEHPSPRVRRTDERPPEPIHHVTCERCWRDWQIVGGCNFPERKPLHVATVDGYTVKLYEADTGGVVEMLDGASEDAWWSTGNGDSCAGECSVLHVDLPESIPLNTRIKLMDLLV